jgi:hypothetical protein
MPHRYAEGLVGREVAVGVKQDLAHLHLQAHQRVQGQRHAVEVLQALVGAAHTGAAPAGQDQACDVVCRNHPPM